MNEKQKAKELIMIYGSKQSANIFINMLKEEIESAIKYIKLDRSDRQQIDNNIAYWDSVLTQLKRF